jgi:integrase
VPSSSYRVTPKKGTQSLIVRIWFGGRQIDRGLGTSDPVEAERKAARLYSEILSGSRSVVEGRRGPPPALPPKKEPEAPTLKHGLEWLKESTTLLDPETIARGYEPYVYRLAEAIPDLTMVGPDTVRSYMASRLQEVQAATVRKELSCLRSLCRWSKDKGLLPAMPEVPGVPKRALGTSYKTRRRSKPDELNPEEIERFLAALPIATRWLGPVRARFVVQYEMGLRSSVLDRLRIPDHWDLGQDYLNLDAKVMKGKRPSKKPLTIRAREELEGLGFLFTNVEESELIFGVHDYRLQIELAIKKALPEKDPRIDRFTGCHLRSHQCTHFLLAGGTLPEAQSMMDHKSAVTTAIYSRTSERMVESAYKRMGRR